MTTTSLALLLQLAQVIAPILYLACALAVTVHALLNKREVHTAIGWIALAWLTPLLGALLYLMFGVNRIKRAGVALGLKDRWHGAGHHAQAALQADAPWMPERAGVNQLTGGISDRNLLAGNAVTPLVQGDEAFPAMLAAIDGARYSVTLLSYIFNNDAAGRPFLAALQRAMQRGVQVRVLIDAVGARYSRVSMVKKLRRAGVPVAAFLPPRLTRLLAQANLRNHRKIMVVDGALGFTGGMNISASHWLSKQPPKAFQCLHFAVRGPVVTDLQRTFAIDWGFTTGESLQGSPWFTDNAPCGPVLARGVSDGPDADIDRMRLVMLGALATARQRVRIITPYFLPDNVLLTTLQVTALRGVVVDIVLPGRSNLPLFDWAMRPQFADLVASGCRVHLTGPAFDHTKLFLVDDDWSLIGSTNWDARSLRLNFEYNLECHDAQLVRQLDALVDVRIERAHRLTAAELAKQSLPGRLRDRLVWLLSPYL
ncbi:MAG: phospholipase [Comamonadaceae bacterium CG_4_9_14_3_um_filter_60_33]|nr:MAG: phospholipase [Comamonadaceae bacterium CG_4_10_14_3_um_filter_60_42]PJB43522.1 MAG: phospholipase [Comamonadaceae bacterium CG_4_9_14_3_um_filter_60_33]